MKEQIYYFIIIVIIDIIIAATVANTPKYNVFLIVTPILCSFNGVQLYVLRNKVFSSCKTASCIKYS